MAEIMPVLPLFFADSLWVNVDAVGTITHNESKKKSMPFFSIDPIN